MTVSSRLRWPSPPLAVQIVALLLAGIVVAQLVTLVLTLLLPPAPPAQHSLADIAAGLRGAPVATQGAKPLLRASDRQPPSLQSPGWFVPEAAHADLARMMNVNPDEVRLLFYAPLPFAGPPTRTLTSVERAKPPTRQSGLADALRSAIAPRAAAQTASPPPFATPAPGFLARAARGAAPTTGFPAGAMRGPAALHLGDRIPGPSRPMGQPPAAWASRFPPASAGGARQRPFVMGGPMETPPARPRMVMPMAGLARPSMPGLIGPVRSPREGFVAAAPILFSVSSVSAPAHSDPAPATQSSVRPFTSETIAAPTLISAQSAPPTEVTITRAPVVAVAVTAAAQATPPKPDPGRPIAPPEPRGLFGLAPAPYVEGDFIAAYRVAPDRWVTLRTQPETFPNSWQKRLMLWFALSFAIVAPLGWIFARRLAAPLTDFARAAERLGREPTAEVAILSGPAEVGQAARAFNQMQGRLRRYVEDRTGMIGAISHDLRTPLARLRFRIERASPSLRREMARDLDQMEAMITSVLTFMRDNAEAGVRQRVDLRSILECAVDDAEVVGAQVSLEPGAPAEVEVDVLSVQRVFANLIDNAIKYGDEAQVRLFAERSEIVAEITDRGPGLVDSDLDRVFLPFYRSAEARSSTRQGVGLGLSTSRSTIRAHGGDICLRRGPTGLVAQVRLPMAGKP
ncbi:ATP-binding protein [Caulobacter sp. ErkDOM-E]|uniref:ATP-binding protein n=1 Tax=Caulobacter sp. ErkDOM-E TaxID=3402778 RepID=UPI003AF72B87